MIPVALAKAPDDFEERVRRPGLDAIAELVGERPSKRRPGPKRKVVASRREDIAPDDFPALWRRVLPDMLDRYHHLCAYLALYIDPATGSASVDHVIPKSRRWDLVYEWPNYRLACQRMNTHKNDFDDVLDPCGIKDGWFALEFVAFQVTVGPKAPRNRIGAINDTIDRLDLNSEECCKARGAYFDDYQDGRPLAQIERCAPFIAREMRRQGKLRSGDV